MYFTLKPAMFLQKYSSKKILIEGDVVDQEDPGDAV